MDAAIAAAVASVPSGGGPFGAVVVKGGRIVGRGQNRVTRGLDPTAHAEVRAIRDACRRLKTFSLEGCELYASCEPCPMCLSSILWARLDRAFFAATRRDAERAGFNDAAYYKELRMAPRGRLLPVRQLAVPGSRRPFDLWAKKRDKIPY